MAVSNRRDKPIYCHFPNLQNEGYPLDEIHRDFRNSYVKVAHYIYAEIEISVRVSGEKKMKKRVRFGDFNSYFKGCKGQRRLAQQFPTLDCHRLPNDEMVAEAIHSINLEHY